ncbi:MAG: type II toxin-antitoxin system death-on-curing family toxin [Candidatus Micrarchaeota archaeon]
MAKIIYPNAEEIIEYNLLVLSIIKVKKADRPEVLSKQKIADVIDECREFDGDIHSKALVLLKGLVKAHAFASGNRRTAFVATKSFLSKNAAKFGIKNEPEYARVMIGIREGFYSDDEIKEWIENGKIRKFER